VKVTVDFDMRGFDRWADGLTRERLARAQGRALNKAAEQGRTAMTREISREYAVTAAFVRQRLRIKRASTGRGPLRLEAWLQGVDPKRSANLIHFAEKSVTLAQARKRMKAGEGGTQTLKGGGQVQKALELRFKIKRSGPHKVIKGAFIGNKGRTVFIRSGDKRLPIQALQTINVPQMFNTKRVNAKVVAKIKAVLPGLMRHELKYELSR
jgi:hypothetical protein